MAANVSGELAMGSPAVSVLVVVSVVLVVVFPEPQAVRMAKVQASKKNRFIYVMLVLEMPLRARLPKIRDFMAT